MAKDAKEAIPVILLFLLVFSLHVHLSIQTSTLHSDAYFTLRQAQAIKETGLPIFNDPLSYSGRTYFFPPLFQYLVALLMFFFEATLAAKIASSLCLALVATIVYMISKYITKNKGVSLIAALFSGLTPAMYFGLDNPSPASLGLLIILLLAYTFLRLEEKNMATFAIALAALSLLTSVDLILFIAGVLFYYILLFLERTKATRKEAELTVFLFFLAAWFNIIVYKRAFINNGLAALWANMPPSVLTSYFQEITFLQLLAYTGLVPIILGVMAVYNLAFETKSKPTQLFIGLAIASFLGVWLKIIPVTTGLLFLSTSMIILSAYAMKSALTAAQKTKFPTLPKILTVLVILLFLGASLPPILSQRHKEAQYSADIDALKWVSANTNPEGVLLAPVEEGFLVAYYANRKNVADKNFMFIPDPEETYSDISQLYKMRLSSDAIRLLNKHDIDYVFISQATRKKIGADMPYLQESGCFLKILDGPASVYQFRGCKI